MKFNHRFQMVQKSGSTFVYKCDNINVRVDFMEKMMRVAQYRDGERLFPTFTVCPDNHMPEQGRDKLSTEGFKMAEPLYKGHEEREWSNIDGSEVNAVSADVFELGEYEIAIARNNFEISCFKNDKCLYRDREYISYNFEHELGNGSCHYVSREPGEKIFGLGDKTGDVNKAGRNFRLGTDDSMGFDARYSDPLYKHVPFYICENSVGSYGIYYDTYSDGAFDFGREHNNYYKPFKSFKCEEETLVYYVLFGSIPEVLNGFARLRGKDFLPPYWTFKYCGSTMTYTDADNADEQLRGFVEQCRKYDLNPGGFYLSSGYTQIGERRFVFNWNTDKIPSPEGLSDYFRENGIEFLPNIKPCLLDDHPMYGMIAEKGWFLKDKNGNPAKFPFWGGFGSYIDFTNPEAADFWTECVRTHLVEKGYRNTWNDNNEYDINDYEVTAEGFGTPISAKLIKPLFSYLMTVASLKGQDDKTRKIAVSRAGITGHSRIASTWTGDNNTSFDDFRFNHKMAMTMSLSGIYNFGQDIGGFSGPSPEPELFLRWIQYGIFTPRFTLHSWKPGAEPTMPWLYPDLIPSVQKLFKLREKLTPYLYNEAWRSTEDYNPIIYPVFLKYPDYDPESDAFFFGNSILACPVFDKGAEEVTVRLPENNGNWYRGAGICLGTVTAKCTVYDEPVYFVKAGSVIYDGKVFTVYPVEEGDFSATYLLDDGISELKPGNHEIVTFNVSCTKKEVKVSYEGSGNLEVRIVDGYDRVFKIEN